jgi:hypothetical protein
LLFGFYLLNDSLCIDSIHKSVRAVKIDPDLIAKMNGVHVTLPPELQSLAIFQPLGNPLWRKPVIATMNFVKEFHILRRSEKESSTKLTDAGHSLV